MRSNRHVPIIYGVVFLSLAAYLALSVEGLLGICGSALCMFFGLPSLRTGLFASHREIEELTGARDLSEDTAKKFDDRI